MNAHSLAATYYGNPSTALKTARSAEYDVIARVTSRIKQEIDGGAMSFPNLAMALDDNRRLWTEFAVDLASPENHLPISLKVQLLNLAQFIITHTGAIMDGQGSADVLVDINTAIMRGLSGKSGTT